MNCVVTAGPTYEPLDQVRRLTNFSTGQLGSQLANFLVERGHRVILLKGYYAIYQGQQKADEIIQFTTTADLRARLGSFAEYSINAVFHAAAVSDFGFGKVWTRGAAGELIEVEDGKVPTRQGELFAELLPTPKIIQELRRWFPTARLVGWKYEVDGDRAMAVAAARAQLTACQTDACVVNGPAYGAGFGFLERGSECLEVPDAAALFVALAGFLD